MALIKCPECGKEISDQSSTCIHCGFPLQNKNECIVNGKKQDLSFILDQSLSREAKRDILCKISGGASWRCNMMVCSIMQEGKIPPTLNIRPDEDEIQSQNALACPKCGSTNITTGARGWKWTTGFIGAGKTVNRCGDCGHTWKPKR